MQRRQLIAGAAMSLGTLALPSIAQAQIASGKGPLRIIVPYTAGGSIDVSVRRVAEKLESELAMV